MQIKRDERELERVKWACRRGMLELDLVLEPYAINHYENASEQDKLAFLALLEAEDQDLFQWFLQAKEPDEKHKDIVNKVLNSKFHRVQKGMR
jgi:antitoxin CptB